MGRQTRYTLRRKTASRKDLKGHMHKHPVFGPANKATPPNIDPPKTATFMDM